MAFVVQWLSGMNHLIPGLALALVASAVVATPARTHTVTQSSAYVVNADTMPSEVGADGHERRVLAVSYGSHATKHVETPKPRTCDVVELAQGNGMVRRCEAVQ